MLSTRRPRHASSTPPSESALIAASAAFSHTSNSNLAAAAAGAALRNATTSPTPPEQQTGSILTKRMLQRRDSYSSVTSDPPGTRPAVVRRASSGGLSERRFRKPSSVRSCGGGGGSLHELQLSLRPQSAGGKKKSPSVSGSVLSHGSPRANSLPLRRRFSSGSESSGRMTRGVQGDYGDSVTSFASDLDSIAENEHAHQKQRRRAMMSPTTVTHEGDTDDEGQRNWERNCTMDKKSPPRRRRTKLTPLSIRHEEELWSLNRERTLSTLAGKRGGALVPPESPSGTSSSPTRTHFGGSTADLVKHIPPTRSVSPAKSALKHPPQHDAPSSTASDRRRQHVRVSFSDEDSVASLPNSRLPVVSLEDAGKRAELPTFGSTRGDEQKRARRETAIIEPLPPVVTSAAEMSDSLLDEDQELLRLETVPELVLIRTPLEEKGESAAIPQPDPSPVPAVNLQPSPPDTPVPGSFPLPSPADSDSDSDSSEFVDALESLPPQPPTNPLPSIAETLDPALPLLSPKTPASPHLAPPMPPLPESFSKPTPTPSRRRSLTPPPRRRVQQPQQKNQKQSQPVRREQEHVLDDSSSEVSVSSFRRSYPRSTGGFRSTMRAGAPSADGAGEGRSGGRLGSSGGGRLGRRYSASSNDSSSEDDNGGKMRRRLGLGIRKTSMGASNGAAAPWKSRFEDSSDDERPGTGMSKSKWGSKAGPGKGRLKKTPTVKAPASGKGKKKEAVQAATDRPGTAGVGGVGGSVVVGTEFKEKKKGFFTWRRKKEKHPIAATVPAPLPTPPQSPPEIHQPEIQPTQQSPRIRQMPPQSPHTQTNRFNRAGNTNGSREANSREEDTLSRSDSALRDVVFESAGEKKDKKKGWKRLFGR